MSYLKIKNIGLSERRVVENKYAGKRIKNNDRGEITAAQVSLIYYHQIL
jgi:hypothetical protein